MAQPMVEENTLLPDEDIKVGSKEKRRWEAGRSILWPVRGSDERQGYELQQKCQHITVQAGWTFFFGDVNRVTGSFLPTGRKAALVFDSLSVAKLSTP